MASMKLCSGVLTLFTIVLVSLPYARSIRHTVDPGPNQTYGQWAGSNRFLVNDTLYFRYDKDHDSVVEVNEQDYDSCNSNNPIAKQEGGVGEFTLPKSGAFYFISGNKTRCEQGEKMVAKVLSTPPAPPTLPPSSAPVSSPPAVIPPTAATPTAMPPSGSGTPMTPGSAMSPGGTTTPTMPGPAMSPGGTMTPTMPGPAMSPGGTMTPTMPGPAMSPGGTMTPTMPGPAMSPGSSTPAMPGPAMSPGGMGMSPSGAMSPGMGMSPSGAMSPGMGMSPSGAMSPGMGMSPSGAMSPSSGLTPALGPAGGPGASADTAPEPASAGGERINVITKITAAMTVLSVSFALISLF